MVKKILITGANGFLGSAITKLGIKKGYKVNILVRKDSNLINLKPLLSKLKVYYGDLKDVESLNQPIKDSDIISLLKKMIKQRMTKLNHYSLTLMILKTHALNLISL